jgi:glutathione S-transferase
MLTLHHSHASPYARKVMIVLHETGQLDQIAIAPAAGSPVDPGTMPVGANPLGKIPALERPDGCTLYDSRVICRWLADRAGGALYPAAPRLYESLTLEATGDGIMDAALLARYETAVRPEALRWDAWTEGQWAKITRSLDALEARWMGHLAGPLCIGQIAVLCALGYLDFRFAHRPWRPGRPALADWAARMAERPSVKATVPPAA